MTSKTLTVWLLILTFVWILFWVTYESRYVNHISHELRYKHPHEVQTHEHKLKTHKHKLKSHKHSFLTGKVIQSLEQK